MIRFTVHGTPQPAGSKRGFPIRRAGGVMGVAIVDANPKSRDWKTTVSQTAQEHCRGALLDGPLAVEFVFFVVRPKGHFGKRGLLPSAPAYPATKPDVLKLARGVEDALSGIAYRDDALIVDEHLVKRFGEREGVEITIRLLEETLSLDARAAAASPEPLPLFAAAGRQGASGEGATTSGREERREPPVCLPVEMAGGGR